jgi:Skp family chaperone for outer membrane proteins
MTSMKMNKPIAVIAAVLALALTSVAAVAQDHPFTEGAVINVEAIRTEHGRFDEYLKFLDTEWKATQEAAKKAGYITSYEVITVEPRGENDPDIYLVIYYKNWAALDGATAKRDAIAKEVDGSVSAADEAGVSRGKIRRVLGSWTGQRLDLK